MNPTTRIMLPLLIFLALCLLPAIAVDANAVATREFFASKGTYSHDAKGFGTYFKKEDVEQLGWDYEAEADRQKHSMTTLLPNLLGLAGLRAHCQPPQTDPHARIAPRPDAFLPSQPIAIEQFEVTISSDSPKTFSILANYVYVDGAFRFVGGGAYPFWSMPDATSHKK